MILSLLQPKRQNMPEKKGFQDKKNLIHVPIWRPATKKKAQTRKKIRQQVHLNSLVKKYLYP